MGADIDLYALSVQIYPEETYAQIENIIPEQGFGGLASSLDSAYHSDLLDRVPTDLKGLDRYKILDPDQFVQHVQANPHLWDEHGLGFHEGLKEIAKNPHLDWWYYVRW